MPMRQQKSGHSPLLFFLQVSACFLMLTSFASAADLCWSDVTLSGSDATLVDVGDETVLDLGGTDGHVDLADNLVSPIGGELSFVVRFRADTLEQYVRLFDLGNGQAIDNLLLYFTNGLFVFMSYYGDSGANGDNYAYTMSFEPALSTPDAPDSPFYNAVVTVACPSVGNSEVLFYVDGAKDQDSSNPNVAGTVCPITTKSRSNNYIGKHNWEGNFPYFDGQISQFAIYKRVLTPEEVQAHHSSTTLPAGAFFSIDSNLNCCAAGTTDDGNGGCCSDPDIDGVCGCAAGTIDDGNGGCCTDPDDDGFCGSAFIPFGATITIPALSACPDPALLTYPWAEGPTWGGCWSSSITATKSSGMIDTGAAWTTSLALTDGLGKNYYTMNDAGETTVYTIYWPEADLTDLTADGDGYAQEFDVTVTESITASAPAIGAGNTDSAPQKFKVFLGRDVFGSVSSASDANGNDLVSFANARLHHVKGTDPDADVFYASLSFASSGGDIDINMGEVIAKGTTATWPAIDSATDVDPNTNEKYYKPCNGGTLDVSGAPLSTAAIDNQEGTCGPVTGPTGLTLCGKSDLAIDNYKSLWVPLDLRSSFDYNTHSVGLVLVVTTSAGFQQFNLTISPLNGFITWCDDLLQGTGAPVPSEVLSVDFYVGMDPSITGNAATVTAGAQADLEPATTTVFSRTESIIAVTAAAKQGHQIELEEMKIFWDMDGSTTPSYTVSYSPSTGVGELTGAHAACTDAAVCIEVADPLSQPDLVHQYSAVARDAAKDFIQPSARTGEVDALLETYFDDVTVPSDGNAAPYNTWLIDPTAGPGISTAIQTVYVFALFRIVQDGTSRRLLLQSGPTGPARSSDGAAGASVRFDVTPEAFAAFLLDISPELVTSWNLQMEISKSESCLPTEDLIQSARGRLLAALSNAATAVKDVQIVSLAVDKAGVQCTGNQRRLLGSGTGPSVEVEALFIFDDSEGGKPSIDVKKLEAANGVLTVVQNQPSSVVKVINEPAPPAAAAEQESTSDSNSTLIPMIAGVAGAALLFVLIAVVWARRSIKAAEAGKSNVAEVAVSMCCDEKMRQEDLLSSA